MSLRLIYGRAGSGKSHFCLNDIKSRLDKGSKSPLILVVPEQFSLQAERKLAATIGVGSTIKAEVLSFRRMAYRVFNEVGGLTRRYINSAGKCMMLYHIIDSVKDNLKVFSKAAAQQGFVNTLLEMIAEMKRYNITPETLKSAGNNLKEHQLLIDKLYEIGTVYEEYEKRLHEKYMDSDDDLTILAGRLDEAVQFNDAEVWIDDFSGFTPQEYRVIEALLKKVKRVNVCLCTDCLAEDNKLDDTDVFSPAKNACKKLLKLAAENNSTVEPAVELKTEPAYRFRESKEIAHLENHLFTFPYSPYIDKTKDIGIFAAVNIYSEVENTARDIISLCRDRNARYRDIAVVTRNLAGYEKLISAIFTEYGIPHFIDSKRRINNHQLVMLVLSVIEIFTNNWSYESVFRYLKTGLTDIDSESMDIIENYVLAWGIRGSRWTQEESWDFGSKSRFDETEIDEEGLSVLNKINETRLAIIKPLLQFREKTKGRRKAREICTALYELLCDIGVPERIENRIEEFKSEGELGLAGEYGQIWNIVMEVFDQIVDVLGEESIGIERFGNVLAIGFGEYKLGLIPPALDQVLVGSVERSKNHEISTLYILGVNDGVFPAASKVEGILSDADRDSLRSLGIELAQDTRARAFEEQHLIYTTVTTAGKYLKLSYPIADHEGRTLRPSIIISRFRRLFPNINECSNIIESSTDEDNLQLVASPVPTFNELLSAVRRQVDGMHGNKIWCDVYRWYAANRDWSRKFNTALTGLSYTNQVHYVDSEKVRKMYGSPLKSSVSRLESFAACPFSFYVQYGLKAKERKIFKLAPPDVGTFMHSVIDRFSGMLNGKNMNWRMLDRETCAREVSTIVDELLESESASILNSSTRYKYLAGRLKRVLARAVWLIAEHIRRSGFDPLGYEINFGEGEKFPPIDIELSSGDKIRLTGRIDRIDTMQAENGTYLRIIDYKSGTKAFKIADVYYGLQIQLVTYLDAIWESGSKDIKGPVIPGGILYFKIDDPIVKGQAVASDEEIEKALMRQLKMKGLLLADVRLVREMDREIDGDSLIIPARINKGDVLGRSSVATAEQFQALRRYARKLLLGMGEEILKGNIEIRPYRRKKQTPCTYCSYLPVCQFDSTLKDNKYRILNDIKDEEAWNMLDNGSGVAFNE